MKSTDNKTVYVVSRFYSGGKREILKVFLKEDLAREYAGTQIITNTPSYVGIETTKIHGTFVIEDDEKE